MTSGFLLSQDFCYPSPGISAVAGRDFHPDFPSAQYHKRGHLRQAAFLWDVFCKGFLHSIIAQRWILERLVKPIAESGPDRDQIFSHFYDLIQGSPTLKALSVYYMREKIVEERTGKYNSNLLPVMIILTLFINLLYSALWISRVQLSKAAQRDPVVILVEGLKKMYYSNELQGYQQGGIKRRDTRRLSSRISSIYCFPVSNWGLPSHINWGLIRSVINDS